MAGLQHLAVGVGDDEVDALDAGLDHRVDRVAAAAADADHLDDGTAGTLSFVVEFEAWDLLIYRSHDSRTDANFSPVFSCHFFAFQR